MRIYWSFDSIPELRNLPHETQKRLWISGFNKVSTLSSLLTSFLTVGQMIFLFGSSSALIVDYLQATETARLMILLIGVLIGAGLGGVVYAQILIHSIRPYLRDEINS